MSHDPALSVSRVRSVVTNAPPPKRGRRVVFALAVIVLTVGMAAVWSVLARRELATALDTQATAPLGLAQQSFETLRERSHEALQATCRIMGEDPRLKSTLNTEGIDAATVADILNDLGKLRRAGFLLVLTPDGRVFAESGAKELQGLDLSASSIVKKAQAEQEAAVGAWVINNRVMDLGVAGLRFSDKLIGYLAVGEAVDEKLLKSVAAQSGSEVATALGDKVVLASSADPSVKAAFDQLVATPGASPARVIRAEGQPFAVSVVDLQETAQSHRLLIARPLGAAKQPFEKLGWMIFIPPAIVLLAVLFALSGSSRRKA